MSIGNEWWRAPGADHQPAQRKSAAAVGPDSRNRLTRWAALAGAASRYREGQVSLEGAARQAKVRLRSSSNS